jgi:PAS domain S-box-containing protein
MISDTSIRILLVEDNTAYAALLKKEFSESSLGPFVVTHIPRLSDALEIIQGRRFHAVLLDLELPDSQGIITLERMLQKKPVDIPLVVVTALEDEDLRVEALRMGADDYLVKGVLTDNVRARSIRYAIERKRAGGAFLTSERRLSLALDASQMGIFDWDLETGAFTWSDQCLRLYGLTPEQFGGTYDAFEQLVHVDDRDHIRQKIDASLGDGSEFWGEYRIKWPDETEHWMEARGRVFHDEHRSTLRMMGTVLDISARKAAERAARIRETEFAHLSRVATMGQMASGLAHELNQPLSSSLNYATACLMQIESLTGFPPGIAAALKEMMTEIRRAGTIISRMRSFVDNQQAGPVSLDMNELVRESVTMMEYKLAPQKIQPLLRLGEKLPRIFGDAVQIVQVLVNLLFNGAEAMAGQMPSQNTLTVRTAMQDDGNCVVVSVVDAGIGILPDNLIKLFQPFFSTKAKGLGMGLNISRSIIESLGGRLWAVPNPIRGMMFCFTVPVATGAIL